MRVYDGSVKDGKLLETVSSIVSTGWSEIDQWEDVPTMPMTLSSTFPDGRPVRVSVGIGTSAALQIYLVQGLNGPPPDSGAVT